MEPKCGGGIMKRVLSGIINRPGAVRFCGAYFNNLENAVK